MFSKIRFWYTETKFNLKQKSQRFKRGFADEDVWGLHYWFSSTFPKMMDHMVTHMHGYPCNISRKDIEYLPEEYIEERKPYLQKVLKDLGNDTDFDLNDPFCIWLLILDRISYCFKMSDEDKYTNKYWESFGNYFATYSELSYEEARNTKEAKQIRKQYFDEEKRIAKEMNNYQKEGFKLLSKYFYSLWD